MNFPHYRAGVGTVIYNQHNEVLLFRRNAPPVGTWQFQQGGIDAGETTEETLWRELEEETGLTEANVAKVTPYPTPTVQTYPPEILNLPDQPNPLRLGQVHRWYFLALQPDVVIDLAKATDQEFDDWKWVSWTEALTVPNAYKVHVYRELHEYFQANLS